MIIFTEQVEMSINCMAKKLLQGKKSILDQSFDRIKQNEEIDKTNYGQINSGSSL